MSSVESWLSAQVAVIGSVLLEERWAGDVVSRTGPEDYADAYRPYFLAIRAMFSAGETIDPVTVRKRLGLEGGGQIMQIMQATPTAANCGEYIDLLVEQSRLRRLTELGARLEEAATPEEAAELVARANSLMVQRERVQSVSMAQALRDFYERQQGKRPDYLTWGLKPLDERLYCERGDLVILGGYPSDGKTALALAFAYHQGRDKPVGFFSFETNDRKLFDRLIPTVSKVDFGAVKRHGLTDADWETLAAHSKAITGNRLELITANGMSVADIKALAVARRFEVIYIDYLQLIAPARREGSSFEQVTQISMDLHNLAQRTGITVVALSQLSRPEKGSNRAPNMRDLRQSGQIEQDADVIMFVYRTDRKAIHSPREIIVAKNKEGEAGGVLRMEFDGRTQTFRPDRQGNVDWRGELRKQRAQRQEARATEPPQLSLLEDGEEDNPFAEEET